ncbi:MAG: CshA/CshB family fibrillar adhesin-related protein [Bacteroidota bacterium]
MRGSKNRLIARPSTAHSIRIIAVSLLVISGSMAAMIFAFQPLSGTDGGYANGGKGTYPRNIFWLTWENGDLANGIHNLDSKTFVAPGGLILTATFSNVTGDGAGYVPNDMNTWSGAVAHRSYQILESGGEAFYGGNGDQASYQISFTATLDGSPFMPPLIFVDGESTDSGEHIEVSTNGSAWEIVENLPGQGVSLSLGISNIARIEDGKDNVSVLMSRSASTLQTSILGTGRQGIAYGIWYAMDYGDAPDIYETRYQTGGARHLQDPTVPLFLGDLVDAETDGSASGSGVEDNQDFSNDEDGVNFPTNLMVSSTYTLERSRVVVTNQSGQDAFLHIWIDFDQSGSFDLDEYVSQTIPNGTVRGNPGADIFFANTVDAAWGITYARIRLSTDPNISASTPGGLAMDGEVEDYAVTVNFTVLPVEWLALEAHMTGAGPEIRWSVARESQTDHYQIERQLKPGGDFMSIGQVKAAGFSEGVQASQYLDADIPESASLQYVKYRIKQVDLDGEFAYSDQIQLQDLSDQPDFDFSLYPNPAADRVSLNVQALSDATGILEVIGANGQAIHTQHLTESGSVDLDVSDWPGGVYFVRIKAGGQQVVKRLVVE